MCVFTNVLATYISRAEAAVRSWRADDPVDVWRVKTLHIHVDQMFLESWSHTNLSECLQISELQMWSGARHRNNSYSIYSNLNRIIMTEEK